MFSYIVGLIAALLFLSNPISQIFFPQQHRTTTTTTTRRASPRPRLNESLLALDGPNDTAPVCRGDAYAARILSREPLVVYLEGFLSEDERRHLLEISEPIFEPSTVTQDDPRTTRRDTSVRDSSVALVPRTETVRCIEARARAFQGWRRDVWIERLRTQRYVAGGHYNHHFDWSANVRGWGRVSSFMAWVDASEDLEGGGTEFPLLETRTERGAREGGKGGKRWWWRYDDAQERAQGEEEEEEGDDDDDSSERQTGRGMTFRVVPGNAVYWENFAPDGRGYDETWHAGLPVKKGVKVGLNIWSFGRIE